MNKNYKIPEWVDENLKKVLSKIVNSNTKIRVFYGDAASGKSWNEDKNVCGFVRINLIEQDGFSEGELILVSNLLKNKFERLSEAFIIKIVETKTKNILYLHGKYNQPFFAVLGFNVHANSEVFKRCNSRKAALRYASFMNGKTMYP